MVAASFGRRVMLAREKRRLRVDRLLGNQPRERGRNDCLMNGSPEGDREEGSMATVQVRYIVNDVDAAIAFYCQHLGFKEEMHPAPIFAMLSRGDLRLVLSAPGGPGTPGGGSQAMPDGRKPEPGGWNRFAIEVTDLEAMVETLRKAGAHFRNDIVTG